MRRRGDLALAAHPGAGPCGRRRGDRGGRRRGRLRAGGDGAGCAVHPGGRPRTAAPSRVVPGARRRARPPLAARGPGHHLAARDPRRRGRRARDARDGAHAVRRAAPADRPGRRPRRRPAQRSRSVRADGAGGCWARNRSASPPPGPATAGGRSACPATVCGCCRTRGGSTPGPRPPGRSAWSASTGLRGSGPAWSSPTSGRSAPATGCAGSAGGSRSAAASCTSPPRRPRRTAESSSWSTRSATTATPRASTARRAASTRASGPRPLSPSTTSAPATGSACASSAGTVGCSGTAPAPGTCARSSTCWPGSAPASSPRGSRTGSSSG